MHSFLFLIMKDFIVLEGKGVLVTYDDGEVITCMV